MLPNHKNCSGIAREDDKKMSTRPKKGPHDAESWGHEGVYFTETMLGELGVMGQNTNTKNTILSRGQCPHCFF